MTHATQIAHFRQSIHETAGDREDDAALNPEAGRGNRGMGQPDRDLALGRCRESDDRADHAADDQKAGQAEGDERNLARLWCWEVHGPLPRLNHASVCFPTLRPAVAIRRPPRGLALDRGMGTAAE